MSFAPHDCMSVVYKTLDEILTIYSSDDFVQFPEGRGESHRLLERD